MSKTPIDPIDAELRELIEDAEAEKYADLVYPTRQTPLEELAHELSDEDRAVYDAAFGAEEVR